MMKRTPRTKERRAKYQGPLTPERLREVLDYDPLTGLFRWKHTLGGRVAGTVAGTVNVGGYIVISIDDHEYRAGRLAWFWTHSTWPENFIRYLNKNRADNRIENLRDATKLEINSTRFVRERSLPRGVRKRGNSYVAEIHHKNKTLVLGSFTTPEAAHERWKQEAALLRPYSPSAA
jgi:hypothetical protein